MFSSLSAPGFLTLYVGGFLFSTARWGLGFLAAFVANDLTGSPRAVQLTGVALWAPLLLAGVVAGSLADRFDRRNQLITVVTLLAPAVALMAVLELTGNLVVYVLYPLMTAVGLSWVFDLTSRRTLVLDVVGPELIDNAMALESLATAMGLAFGVVAGGAVVQALGIGQAFGVIALLLVAAAVLFSRAQRSGPGDQLGVGSEGDDRGLRSGLRLAARNRGLRSGVGVTVAANVFYFSHTPLVPVFAERLGAGPLRAGLLASAGGLGMMLASLGVARRQPPRGPTYVAGATLALVSILGLGLFSTFALVFVALLVAAVGFGLFAATQSVVIMTSVGPEHRGRAMGLLSMAIGALPFGMYSLGEVAEALGPPTAVIVYAVIGLVALGAWIGRRPEVLSAR